MAQQDANAVAITGGTINGATVGATTPAAGTFTTLTATGNINLTQSTTTVNSPSGTILSFVDGGLSPNTGAYLQLGNGATSAATQRAAGANTNISIFWLAKGTGFHSFNTNNATGTQQMVVAHTASAVNFVQVTGSATSPSASALANILFTGSDAGVNAAITTKGTGYIAFSGNSSTSNQAFRINTTNATNTGVLLQVQGAVSGNTPVVSAISGSSNSDANIPVTFQSKGTGAINLAPGSSGVNISNGGTVTAITRTATGGGYTSIPSVAISAPTTAGGVQATVSATMFAASATVQNGGTGYTVGNVLTVVGGTFSSAATFTVSSVSGGAVTAVTLTSGGTAYSVLPTNPVSVTGGTGSNATLNITAWGVSGFTITNAGSGYVEQPTVTFSGGGGSGAAAYATVGSIPRLTSIGSSLEFAAASGIGFRVANSGTANVSYYSAQGNSSGGSVLLTATGTDTDISSSVSSKGAGSVRFQTNNSAQEQARIAHTASAVNYVQVTGAATGGSPTISAQGSDANVNLILVAKGGNSVVLQTRGGGTQRTSFLANDSGSNSVNFLQATSHNAGSAPILSAQGTDTNIDLALTPKGTGNVRFGTYTANMALVVQGYIEIKDSGGTVRKLAVIA
jgi:hypothetical protein